MICKHAFRILPVCYALLLSGCLQIDTRVKIHEDGSATITERLQFSRRLLDLDAQQKPADQRYAKMLSKEGSLARMQKMGKGVALVSHKLQDGELASRESITVYKIPDLAEFRYMSPYLAYLDYPDNNGLRFHVGPVQRDQFGTYTGHINIGLRTLKSPKGEPRLQKGQAPPKGPAPREMQIYREMGPIFADVLSQFRVRLVFESYCPLSKVCYGYRGRSKRASEATILDFSHENLDNFGGQWVENEEIMLDMVRWDFRSPDIVRHVRNWVGNRTLPVFLPWGSRHMWYTHGPNIHFRPSPQLFKKHVEGKTLDFGRKGGKRTTTFAEVGWKPKKK